ncbi:MAG: FG-GAP repeat protein [Polyangiaceae bacterium]
MKHSNTRIPQGNASGLPSFRGPCSGARRRAGRLVRGLLCLSLLGGLGVGACSWSRYDDLQDNAPVLLLKKPDKLKDGFGISLAFASTPEEGSRVLVTGAPYRSRGAAFSVVDNQDAKVDAIDTGFCDAQDGSNLCYMANSVAGIGLARAPGGTSGTILPLCFVLGVGEAANGSGLLVRCQDQTEYALGVPDGVKNALVDPVLQTGEGQALYLAADKDDQASVIAGAPAQTPPLAWFYPPDSMTPIELLPSANDPSYGSAVASLRVADGRVLAVGAPEENHVYLFHWKTGATAASLVGCLGGPERFGRALAAGRVDAGDATDELIVADGVNVHVFDGSKLAELPAVATPSCSLASLPAATLLTSFGCGSDSSVTGCDSSDFGATLEVADLDGDGDGEVIVGAPRMKVRDADSGGAVLVYDAEGDRPFLLSDVLFLSSAEEGDRLGSSLAIGRTGGQEFVIAGAPGNEKTALMFCSSFSSGLAPRCD